MTTANQKLPEELTFEHADAELDTAREALERVEHGADDKVELHRYLTALRARNIAWREMNRARRARRARAEQADAMKIVVLEGRDLIRFHDMIRDLDRMINDGSIETLRIAIDGEGVKAKPGTASWSPGFGVREE